MIKIRPTNFSPGRIVLLSFFFVISIGTFLLSLPQAREVNMLFTDILFTAVSTTCVTGLSVVPVSSFTLFGKCIILAMIQIGGLGLMTLSFFLASLFLNLGIASRLMAGQLLEFEFWSKVRYFLLLIIGLTFSFELLGTIYLYFQFKGTPGIEDPLFAAFFHSISAFCHAGISLFDDNLITFATKPLMLLGLGTLMLAGSLGFVVWYDIASLIKKTIQNKLKGTAQLCRLSLHSKLVLLSTILLTLTGAILIWLLEYNNIFKGISHIKSLSNSLFMSLSARSIGFKTINLSQAHLPTLFLLLPLMFIGASPGSTGSGIKTTTFIVFVATVFSIMQNRPFVELGGRRIPHDQIYKVMAIVALALFWIFSTTFILLITEPDCNFMQILLESVSAFGTCGISTGITPYLSKIGKFTLMTTMLVGRAGSLTLVLALRKKATKHLYEYPEERIMIG